MIERGIDALAVSGRMTMAEAAHLLEDGCAALASPTTIFDLSAVTVADSAALSVLFGWLRAAQQRNIAVTFRNTPANLLSLAEVYGVTELLAQH
jgi:phospholipid transport system transporter-binding protein